ncbi:MAG: undecaprenyl-diphosphate phosphatase [Bacilli bacterium]|nr:undecaprenyl-diphosphate phosphatase [Bacilli bacterium]
MNIIKYIILGIIQGITEPLPISSSGHLLIFRELFNTNMFNDLNFEVIVNFGSFLAILLIFWKDIIKLITGFFKYLTGKKEFKKEWIYSWLIVLGSIPVGIVGFLFKDNIESIASVKVVGYALIVTAIALFLVKNTNGKKEDKDLTVKDAIIIGLFQMCALLPGLSRSGMVLVGCLLCKLSKESSLKYTFMLYFPVSLASFGLSTIDVIKQGIDTSLLINYSLGLVAAFIATYYSYKWLSSLVKNGKLWKFSIYCLCVAIFVLIYFR